MSLSGLTESSKGSHILTTLTAHQSFNKVLAYTRKDLPSDPKVTPITSSDSSDWPSLFPNDTPICFSALGTTRARAGGLDKQRSIDLDLNLAIAKAAKERGTKVYVLISSHGANAASMIPYTKLKGEIEEGVKAIGFEHCVILRPGLIVGERGSHDSRPAEFVIRKVATLMGGVSMRLQDPWAQDVEVSESDGEGCRLIGGDC